MSKKHYIITSITLGAIAASSAVLIGLANMVTKDQIVKNEQAKVLKGITQIFGEGTEIISEHEVSYGRFVKYQYNVTGGYAFRTTGSNMYGKISLLVGFTGSSGNYKYTGVYMVTDEQTYASTLEDNYIPKINDTEDYESVDVHCGATYGATTVHDMIKEAKDFIESWIIE